MMKSQSIIGPNERYVLLDLESEDENKKTIYRIMKYQGQVDGINSYTLTTDVGTMREIRDRLDKLNKGLVYEW